MKGLLPQWFFTWPLSFSSAKPLSFGKKSGSAISDPEQPAAQGNFSSIVDGA
jgi:hypothetical protein